MTNIWVVMRSEGEWSDRFETCVCWFPSKPEARAFVTVATPQSREAARRWRAFVDSLPDEDEATVLDRESFCVGLLDQSFNPDVYSEHVNYYICEVARGADMAHPRDAYE